MILGALLSLGGVGCIQGPTRHSPPAKLDGDLLRDVRRADALGLAPTALLSSGPSSENDLARALSGDRAGRSFTEPEDSDPTLDEQWHSEAIERHQPKVDDAWDQSEYQATYFEPVHDARLRLVFVDETVSFYNERGRKFNEGANIYLSNRSVARLSNRLLLSAEPELSLIEHRAPADPDAQFVLRFQELILSTRLGPLEVTAGRTSLWWGPGRHGSLLLTNNASPLDLIKLSTAGPVSLPGFLEHLGLLKGEIFVSRLESARDFPRPYFAGARIGSRLLPWVEVGASRTAMFGGRGRPGVTGQTILDVITARSENDEDDPGNQLASIDLRVIVPWSIQPFEIYGELGGEDESGGFFSREAYLAGIYLPRLGPWRLFELTLEFANTTTEGHPRTWYTNRNFPDGYTYHERIIGHHVGTDGLDVFAELRIRPTGDIAVYLSYDYEEHFRQDPVEERLHQFRIGIEARVWRKLRVSGFLGYDRWNNFGLQRGAEEEGHVTGLGAAWEF